MASDDEVMRQLVEYTAQQFAAGKSASAVKADLIAQGVPQDAAGEIVRAVHGAKKSAVRSAGLKQVAIGVGMIVIGGGITMASYSSAASAGGGKYTVMTGLIAVGAIYALMGVFKLLTGAGE